MTGAGGGDPFAVWCPFRVERWLKRAPELSAWLESPYPARPPFELDPIMYDPHYHDRDPDWQQIVDMFASLEQAVDALPAWPYRQMIHHHYWQRQSFGHIARIQGCSRQTVMHDCDDAIEVLAIKLGWRGDAAEWRQRHQADSVLVWRGWEDGA